MDRRYETHPDGVVFVYAQRLLGRHGQPVEGINPEVWVWDVVAVVDRNGNEVPPWEDERVELVGFPGVWVVKEEFRGQ